jgi:hypothetical protein
VFGLSKTGVEIITTFCIAITSCPKEEEVKVDEHIRILPIGLVVLLLLVSCGDRMRPIPLQIIEDSIKNCCLTRVKENAMLFL